MEPIKDLAGLLMHHVNNLYAAEAQQLNALPAIIDKAKNGSLKKALEHHLKVTAEQKDRLTNVIQLIREKLKDLTNVSTLGKTDDQYISKGMQGLIEEANEILHDELSEDVTDAVIIAAVQKMEHYEITTYGTAHAYAGELKLTKVEALLKEALDEEYDADDLLSALATASVNKKAEPAGLKTEDANQAVTDEEPTTQVFTSGNNAEDEDSSESTRAIKSPGGRAGTSHRRYRNGESRGH